MKYEVGAPWPGSIPPYEACVIYQRYGTKDLIRRAELVCEFGGDR